MKLKIILWNLLATAMLIGSCAKTEPETFGRIQGIVSDTKGEPLQAATVTLSPGGKATTTGSDGRYDYTDLTPGTYTVQVVKDGFQSNTRQVAVEAGVTVSGDVQLSNAYGAVKGFVKDAETQATIQAAVVGITPGNHSAVTGSDGYYIFSNLAPGTYTIQVVSTGYAAYTKLVDVTAGNTAQGDILLHYGSGNLKVNKQNLELGANENIGVFEISNNGQYDLDWNIEYDCAWISEITPLTGTTKPNNKTSVTVRVDRSKLPDNKTQSSTVIIASNGGSAALAVSVNGGTTPGGESGGGKLITPDLFVYYTFDDGKATDLTESGIDGSFFNAPNFIDDTPDKSGKAVSFIATKSQYLNIPTNPIKDLKQFSFSFWVKDIGSTGQIMSAKASHADASQPTLNVIGSTIYVYMGFGSYEVYGAGELQDNAWHMLSYTYGNSMLVFYVDGKKVSTKSGVSYSTGSSCPEIRFGGDGGAYGQPALNMKLDNVRVYGKALSDTEVKTIYEAEK